MLESSGLYYPNRIARAFLLATEEVMGKTGLNTVLSLAQLTPYLDQLPPDNVSAQFDFAGLSALSQALEELYGKSGGRGMALRIGRASFARGIKSFGALGGMADPAFRRLPLEQRAEIGLTALATMFTSFSDQPSHLEMGDTHTLFVVEVSPFAWGRHSDKPVCHALVGIIQECLRWASNGREYLVQEVACSAMAGDHCIFRVSKQPIGQR